MEKFKLCIYILIFFTGQMCSFGQTSICNSSTNSGTDTPPGCLFCADTIQGSNGLRTAFPIPDLTDCWSLENNVFFAIRSDSAGKINFDIRFFLCSGDGMEFVILDENLNRSSHCYSLKQRTQPYSIEVQDLEPKKNYSLMLDGVDGSLCNYEIVLKSDHSYGESIAPAGSISVEPDVDLSIVCTGLEIELSIPSVEDALIYDWKYPEPSVEFIEQNQNKLKLKTVFASSFDKTIKVTPYNGCRTGGASPPEIIQPLVRRYAEVFLACPAKLPFEYNGIEFTHLHTIYKNYKSSIGCDSFVYYTPDTFEIDLRIIDTFFCVDEIFQVGDHVFDSSGFYQFFSEPTTDYLCDTSIELTLKRTGDLPPVIECIVDTFLNTYSFKWNEIPLATGYRLMLNEDSIPSQSSRFFLYKPNSFDEKVDFLVQPFNSRGCYFEPAELTCSSTDLSPLSEKEKEESIQIFPNPSTDIFQISTFFKLEKTEVFDFSGRRILVEKGSEIDLTNYAEGIYVFKIFTEKGVIYKRVLKK